jgi:ABC-type lipopolysaccharide export system ATPase subunit
VAADTVIATRDLTKRYRDTLAVDSLALDVRRGEVYGFLGRNGAQAARRAEELLGRGVDLVRSELLKGPLRDRAHREAVEVWRA